MKFISCPKCKCQYLPGEIFDPKHFLGQPRNVIRNTFGEILGYDGIPTDLEETFVCENCNTTFNVIAKVSYETFDANDISNNEKQLTMESVELF